MPFPRELLLSQFPRLGRPPRRAASKSLALRIRGVRFVPGRITERWGVNCGGKKYITESDWSFLMSGKPTSERTLEKVDPGMHSGFGRTVPDMPWLIPGSIGTG